MSKLTKKVCPICDSKDMKYPALSRYDNKTDVCSDCGMIEAFNGNIILTSRKLNLSFDNYAFIMHHRGGKNPLALGILKASKEAMKQFNARKGSRK